MAAETTDTYPYTPKTRSIFSASREGKTTPQPQKPKQQPTKSIRVESVDNK